jgi:hypothetical protein
MGPDSIPGLSVNRGLSPAGWMLSAARLFRTDRSLSWLALTSLAFAAFWQWNCPVVVTPDSLEYLQWAQALAGQTQGSFSVQRTPGYPLVLFLTGVPFLHTFWITRAVQGLMAAAIPCLVYGTLRPWSARAAAIVGWATMASTIPYTYSTHVMTEQTSMFLLYLLLLLALRALARLTVPSWPSFIGLAVVGWSLLLVRPANGLIFYAVVGTGLLFHWEWRRRWLAIVALVFCLNGLWVAVDREFLTSGGVASTTVNRRDPEAALFAETYYRILARNIARRQYGRPLLDASRGPASQRLLEQLGDSLRRNREDLATLQPAALFAGYAAAPEALLQRIATEPSGTYCAFVPAALARHMGQGVARETIRLFAREQGDGLWGSIVRGMPLGVSSRMDGKMLFWQLYNPARFFGEGGPPDRGTLVLAENGPATRFLLDQTLGFLRLYPGWNTQGNADWSERFKGRPEDQVRDLLDHPDLSSFSYWWLMMDARLGPAASNELFKQVAFEGIDQSLRLPLLFWDNFVSGLVGPGEALFNDGIRVVSLSQVPTRNGQMYPHLGLRMNREIAQRTRFGDLNRLPYAAVYLLRPFLVVGVILFALFALQEPGRAWFCCGAAVWMLQVAVLAVFSCPHVRYTDYLVPLQLMLLAVGATAWQRARTTRDLSHVPA